MNTIDLERQSQALFELYEQQTPEKAARLADTEEDEQRIRTLDAIYGASQWKLMWRKFVRNRIAVVGGVIILIFYMAVLLPGFFAPYAKNERFGGDYISMAPQKILLFHDGKFQPAVYGVSQEMNTETWKWELIENKDEIHPIRFFTRGAKYSVFGLFESDIHLFGTDEGIIALFGTDGQGRDLFSRIVYGAQISLSIGLVGVILSLILGTVLGIASGYYGGVVDDLIQRLIEIVRSFPTIPLWMALAYAIPPHWPMLRKYFLISIILSLIGWTWLARQLRGKVLALRNEEFITAAKLAGASDARIIFRHLIPATFSHIIVVATLAMPAMILAETALSYLGLGLRPPEVSWGVLLNEAKSDLNAITVYPWVFLAPTITTAIAILAFNFLGDGLRDASDPYTL